MFTLSILLISLLFSVVLTADIEQYWEISYKTVHPDGVPKTIPVVNGQYPGPEVRGRVGQTVRIEVTNSLVTDTTSIHWHGIKQDGTPWNDGVPGITQCPIEPGQTFVYEFKLDSAGTLWWHSHSGLQKSSLYGAIVIEGDSHMIGNYEEHTLLLNDWFHDGASKQVGGLLDVDFKWVGNPQSLLFNGKGVFNCPTCECGDYCKPCNETHEEAGPFVLEVEPGRVYRLRLVGASSLLFLNLGIEGHVMTVVEAETTLLKPIDVQYLDIGSGQTYSVLLKTKTREELAATPQNNGLFWMQLNLRHRSSGPTGYAILKYSTATNTATVPLRRIPSPPGREDVSFSLHQIRRMRPLTPTRLPPATRTVKLLGLQGRLENGLLRWAMNNVSYIDGRTPLLHAVKLELEEETSKYVAVEDIPFRFNYSQSLMEAGISDRTSLGTQVFKFAKDEVVDFVFQNARAGGGQKEVHTWHLHLHNFWVLGYGEEESEWTPADMTKYRLWQAVERNTFTLYPDGWTAIRVKFDNPGVAHFLQVGNADDIPPPPAGTRFCGAVPGLMGPPVRNPFVSGECAAS